MYNRIIRVKTSVRKHCCFTVFIYPNFRGITFAPLTAQAGNTAWVSSDNTRLHQQQGVLLLQTRKNVVTCKVIPQFEGYSVCWQTWEDTNWSELSGRWLLLTLQPLNEAQSKGKTLGSISDWTKAVLCKMVTGTWYVTCTLREAKSNRNGWWLVSAVPVRV